MRLRYLAAAGLWITTACYSCRKDDTPVGAVSGTDSFTVSVTGGYGGGTYREGDTVHLFSEAYGALQLFNGWTGDTDLLDAPAEWHTWFIMPARNVSVTAHVRPMESFALQFARVQGKARLKPVYYYFPTGLKGVVYLLHGTGGNAQHLVSDYEWQQLIKSLVDSHYGIIVTESEESTTGVDGNGDGKIRWTLLPYDSVANTDFANIRLITDYFYKQGTLSTAAPRYAIGMSDGGFFAAALSALYGYRAEVNYCSQGSSTVISQTTVPIQFCMARNDENANVGQAGNEEALANALALAARGVCSGFLIKERCPVYPERFARSGQLSLDQSRAVFAELERNGFLDGKDYFIGTADDLSAAVQSHPDSFPVISGLPAGQQTFVTAQVTLSISDHRMYSDYDAAAVAFLEDPCH